MILSRITKAVREQNWFAVGLEFVIVVAGVMLAFQLTSLSQSRSARIEERADLLRLLSESEGAVNYVDARMASSLESTHMLDRSIRALNEGALNGLDIDDFERGVWASTRFSALTPPRAVTDELIASGRIGALTDVEVREAVSRYNRSLDRYAQQLPYFRQVATQPDDIADGAFSSVYRPDLPERRETRADFNALVQNEVFVREITGSIYGQIIFLRYTDLVRQEAFNLCQAVARAVDQPCNAEPFTLVIFDTDGEETAE
ncbi:hypothetical protein L5876_08525 [Hyphobacterium sp. SN044]|uniref:hypothetical protein n=1 Tax=Hyphobacterium sp. SN044 TaxID=2912575 RepID=UPI001F3D5F6B|nr:hypothetical protein [Hyphobacterium sp. SN044]MCF8879855.1 hypothetical protein [Hyphobacterium sp. SN044]